MNIFNNGSINLFSMPKLSITEDQYDSLSESTKKELDGIMMNLRKQSIERNISQLSKDELYFVLEEVSKLIKEKQGD